VLQGGRWLEFGAFRSADRVDPADRLASTPWPMVGLDIFAADSRSTTFKQLDHLKEPPTLVATVVSRGDITVLPRRHGL